MGSMLLTKLLPQVVYPLGVSILMGIFALALSFTNCRRLGQVVLAFALLVLWLASTPIFASWLNWRVAIQVQAVPLTELPSADVIILLGGTPISRIAHALTLHRHDKAPRILVTGGNLPWSESTIPEAERVADLLVDLGASSSTLVLETASRTTRENAVNTASLFREHGWREGLLVTSGTHMPRALAAFESVGLEVIPSPTDVPSPSFSLRIRNIFDILPDAAALNKTTLAIKEILGLAFYRIRGWV